MRCVPNVGTLSSPLVPRLRSENHPKCTPWKGSLRLRRAKDFLKSSGSPDGFFRTGAIAQHGSRKIFMASPFSYFRKNQRLWMAAAVLIAILSFVVAPMLQSFTGRGSVSGRRDANAKAASWSGGSITQDQLDIELGELAVANTFLKKLAFDVREKGGFPKVPEVRPDFALVGITPDTRDPSSILERKILAAEANRMGIHFDDQSVKTFLQKFVDGKLSGEQIQKALREVSGGRMSLVDFNRLMKEELAKNAVLRLANGGQRYEERANAQGLPTAVLSPPSKNWQYFTRFKRRASVETYPVFVKDFEESIDGKPTDKELRELFEKGKELTRINQPILTEPAFMTPELADFEFIACDIEKIIDEEKTKITEELLRSEYERRAKEKVFDVPLTEEEKKALQEKIEQEKKEQQAKEPAPANLPPTLDNPDSPAPAPAPAAEPAPAPAAEPAPAPAAEPAPAPAADPAPAPAAEPAPPPAANPQSSFTQNQASRLVSFQDPAPVPPVEVPAPVQPAAETPAPETPAAVPQATEVPANPVPANPLPATALPAAALPATENPSVAPSAAPQATPPEAPAVPMRTQSFEEVKEALARELAAGPAFRVLEQRVNEMRDLMETYAANRRAWERAVAEKDTSMKEPEMLNLQQIADKYGFQFGRTGLVDVRTASSLPIGRSRVSRGPRMQPFEFPNLIRFAPNPNESDSLGNLYMPLQSTALLTRYLFWKVAHEASSTPSFETARESVTSVWKMQRAAEKAESKAKAIATKASSASLAESLESDTERGLVVRPTPFSWFNPLMADFDIQLSNVENLKPLDNDFMEKVFAAEPGTTLVASDAAKEIYYVVKVLDFSPSEEDLMLSFSAAPNTGGVQNVSNMESSSLIRSWFSTVQKQLGFQSRQ